MKKIALFISVLSIFLAAPKAFAMTISVDGPTSTRSTIGTDNDAGVLYAQSFLVGQTSVISNVSLNLKRSGNPNEVVVILTNDVNGAPSTGDIITHSVIAPSQVTTVDYSWVTADFTAGILELLPGHYWIVVYAATTGDMNDNYDTFSTISNEYADGAFLVNNAPFVPNFTYQGVWNTNPGDLFFKVTLVPVPTTSPEPTQNQAQTTDTTTPTGSTGGGSSGGGSSGGSSGSSSGSNSTPPAETPTSSIIGGAMPTVLGVSIMNNLITSKILKPGLRANAEVKIAQQKLKTLGMYNGPINGNYGPLTKAAVKKFQKANKLTTDGILGVKTIELLNKVI